MGVAEPALLIAVEGIAVEPIVASCLAIRIVGVVSGCTLCPVHAIPFEKEHGKEVALGDICVTRSKLHWIVIDDPVSRQGIRRALIIHLVANEIVDRIADGVQIKGWSRSRRW